MKVLEARDAFISDYEALQFLGALQRQHKWDDDSLKELNSRNNKRDRKNNRPYNHPALQAITNDTVSYLSVNKNYVEQEPEEGEEFSAADLEEKKKAPISKMNDDRFCTLMQKLDTFGLYKVELLQIVNQLPTNMVHLFSIIEECDTRFNEEQIQSILDTIAEYV